MTHWERVDTFIYFSHERVTIPPAAWADAARRSGSEVLGTFIVEWADGQADMKEILDAEDAARLGFDTRMEDVAAWLPPSAPWKLQRPAPMFSALYADQLAYTVEDATKIQPRPPYPHPQNQTI